MNTRTAALLVKRVLRSPRLFAAAMSAYPPLFAAGVRIRDIPDDWSSAHLVLKVNRLNSNAHGAAFGGSLFSMTDAMFGMLVMQRLGRENEAWTRTGTFQYINPGRNNAHATIQVTDAMVEQIKHEITSDGFCNIPYTTVITNDDGSTVGIGQQELHCRLRKSKEAQRSHREQERGGSSPRVVNRRIEPHEARGITLLSLATAVAWRAFGPASSSAKDHDADASHNAGTLTTLLSAARRIPDPEDRARFVVKKVLEENALTPQDIQEMGIPSRLIPKE
ncbi:YiiD C-terminal domain-containing protein [Corynebacterium kroppenstedtii]|uniref:Putative secreted protein n=1 Tax=Corynebacterium kroppenstedtii (strain DSM 44385 / JCM 11950 / CIP 105744 / CCUG 35717) TaxID=645127 RepID=C4LLL9_CORK4|nr:DUF4442 domain-containing protein [Corynebacterium kroppenstedtii]ACR18724.1 putative secreted protein [Corynebacterium kroppenstedtii DSM 44385]QRP09980.1 YiiD C-terminal domain-containing protein [Corynebacterium kroppenstedtii]